MTAERCSNHEILKSLSFTLDRLEESAWHIRMMEQHYHRADYFRWSLNSFLRSLKEVVQLLTMDVQGNSEIVIWLREEKEKLNEEPLIAFLFKQRDIVVHRAMLKPASKGTVGFTRGRGLKLGLGMPIDPLADSEDAILRYIRFAAKDKDFLGILYTEEDGCGEYTCVQREWRMEQCPDTELTELAAQAWERVAKLTLNTATKLGASVIEPKFELQNPNRVQFEIYRPEWVKEQLEKAKARLEGSTT
ncbi:hypothetical protein [Aeromonas veronii]|uniref:hypothetical protein n=1 Tax=Aeromonas veronii TaxID=654 RepID=UPI001BCF283F|nr:hypothetical protein [Aeromonas veronii]MBS4726518.1 hypothetical protein [Aeromonas veronii]